MSYPQVIHNFGKLKLGCNELKLGCNELKLGCNELKLGCNLPIFKSASVLGVTRVCGVGGISVTYIVT